MAENSVKMEQESKLVNVFYPCGLGLPFPLPL